MSEGQRQTSKGDADLAPPSSDLSFPARLPVRIIACRVLESQFARLSLPGPLYSLDYGLHRWPKSLTAALQAELDAIAEPSLVLLGYGLCGNGTVGLKARHHYLVIPRCDDCISILMGTYEAYRAEFDSHPGTYYLSKGWLECGSHPLREFRDYADRYGEEQATWLIDQQYHNCKRVALIGSDMEELAAYRDRATEVAAFLKAEYVEIVGSGDLLLRLIAWPDHPGESNSNLVVVPPGGRITANLLLR